MAALTLLLAAIAYLVLAPAARADDSIPSVAPAAAAPAAGDVAATAAQDAAAAVPAAADTASTTASSAADTTATAAAAPAEPQTAQSGTVQAQYHEAETPQYHGTEAISAASAPAGPAPEPAPANVRSATPAPEPVQAPAVASAAAKVAQHDIDSAAPVARVAMRVSNVSGATPDAPKGASDTAVAAKVADRLVEVAKPTATNAQPVRVLPKSNSRSQFQFDGVGKSVSPAADSVISGGVTSKAIENQILRSRPAAHHSISRSIGAVECGAVSHVVQRMSNRTSNVRCAPEKQAADGSAASGLEHAAHKWLAGQLSAGAATSAIRPEAYQPAAYKPARSRSTAAPAPRHASPAPSHLAATTSRASDPGGAPAVAGHTTTAVPSPATRSSRASQPALTSDLARRVGRTLLRPLGVVGPIGPPAEQLHDTRLMLQIGMLLGLGYLGFLALWFWRTRFRGRLGRSARV